MLTETVLTQGSPLKVTLTEWELLTAGVIGLQRGIESMKNGHQDRSFTEKGSTEISVTGVEYEKAVCKALGIYYSDTVNTFSAADCGRNIEVKGSPSITGRLIIKPHNQKDRYYVLVTGSKPTFTVHGWIHGSVAMVDEFKWDPNNRGWAYFIPQERLSRDWNHLRNQ